MTRTAIEKSLAVDEVLLASSSRLKARVLAILHGAIRVSGKDQQTLASDLGLRKAAVNRLLKGNGNIQIETLGEYLAALGFEADVTVVPLGELSSARRERRAPMHVCVTISDQDRLDGAWFGGESKLIVHASIFNVAGQLSGAAPQRVGQTAIQGILVGNSSGGVG